MKTPMAAMAALIAGLVLGLAGAGAAQEVPDNAEDVVWARPGGLELQARIYRPEGPPPGPLPTVIDVHGGAWRAADRTSGEVYGQALARAGYLVVAVDFRMGPDHRHPTASADVAAAVRWVRLNAGALGADADRIALIGSSSGGHLAMLAAVRPDAEAHRGTPITTLSDPNIAAAPHDELDANVDAVVALWPVSDPLARFRYAQRAGIEFLLGGHEAYFGSDPAAMLDASIPAIVSSGEAGMGAELPDLLVVQPGEDSNVPQAINLDLVRAWQSRDGHVEYAFYPGQAHAFGHRESPQTDDMAALAGAFLNRRLK